MQLREPRRIPTCWSPDADWTVTRPAVAEPIRTSPDAVCTVIESAEIDCDAEMPYHLDGEIGRMRGPITVRILPKLLTVRVPR